MPNRKFTSSDSWPRHPTPRWQESLDLARDAGWSLTKLSNHWWGRIDCPAGEHFAFVDSTARDSEVHAKEVAKDVRRTCQHGNPQVPGSKAEGRIAAASDLLVRADQLVELAESRLELTLAAAEGAAQLQAAEELELLLGAAEANAVSIRAEINALLEAAAQAPEQPDVDRTLELATESENAVEEASIELARIRRPGLVKALYKEAEEILARIAAVRSQLDTVQERNAETDG